MQEPAYTRTAVALHWLIAICVIAQIARGLWMIGIPKDPPGIRAWWFNVHKSIGLTLGLMILFRVYWRITHRAPPLPETLPRWQRITAAASHHLLYLCMVVMPVSGYLGSSFTKYPIVFFGTKLPHWGWDAPALKCEPRQWGQLPHHSRHLRPRRRCWISSASCGRVRATSFMMPTSSAR
jgi:cytochrome b561